MFRTVILAVAVVLLLLAAVWFGWSAPVHEDGCPLCREDALVR